MFTGYILDIDNVDSLMNSFEIQMNIKGASERFAKVKESLQQNMSTYLLDAYDEETDSIIMKSLEKDFFPNVHSHIFISHSSKDKESALALAGFLWKNCKIDTFIDSMLWEYCDDLLRTLDHIFSRTGFKSYDYNSRNITTAQVHILLNMALAKMINTTECFIFLGSNNSLKRDDFMISSEETESPWIYSELLLSEIIQKRLPKDHRILHFNESFSHSASEIPSFIYDASLSQLQSLSHKNIIDSIARLNGEVDNARAEKFLDYLYDETGVNV